MLFEENCLFLGVTAFSALDSWTSIINSYFSAEGGMNSHVGYSIDPGSSVTTLEKEWTHKDIVNTWHNIYYVSM